MVKMTFKELSPELTEEEVRELEAAELRSPVYDEESPEMTMEQLQEFKRMNHENRTKPTISLRLSPATLKKQDSTGRGIPAFSAGFWMRLSMMKN